MSAPAPIVLTTERPVRPKSTPPTVLRRMIQAGTLSCHYCAGEGVTWDHVVPVAWGGRTEAWNLVAACSRCNSRKGRRMPSCPCGTCRGAMQRFVDDLGQAFDRWESARVQDEALTEETTGLADLEMAHAG